MSPLFGYALDLSDPVVVTGAVALTLIGIAQALKTLVDLKNSFGPKPAYDERFAGKGEVIRLAGRLDKIEGWVEQRLEHHLSEVSTKIDGLRESHEGHAKTVNAELQSIQRSLGRLEGTKTRGAS